MKRVIIAATLAVAAVVPVFVGEAEQAADRFADAATKVEDIHCTAKHASQTIVCLVRTDDSGTE